MHAARVFPSFCLSHTYTHTQVLVAILAGSGIPLLMYLIWEAVILGTLTPGSGLQGVTSIIASLRNAAGASATVAVQVNRRAVVVAWARIEKKKTPRPLALNIG